jgi:ADP-ribosylglycohydrolase
MTLPPGDRAAGCLLGLALGDALGFVVEAAPPAAAAAYVETELRAGLGGARGRPPFQPGQYSDDTQLARELLLSIKDAGDFDPPVFAGRVAGLFARGAAIGAGPGSREAAERLQAGVGWETAGTPAPYAGNGAAMRAGPLGALYPRNPVRLVEVARDQALVTHRDPRAVAGAIAVAGAVAIGARPGPVLARAVLEELGELVRPADESMGEMLRGLVAWLAGRPGEAALRVAALAEPAGTVARVSMPWGGGGVSPFVIPSVAWSLYAFLRSPDDYWETICTAIEIGGDTDTLAAMAGAMAGGRLGPAALPPRMVDRLTDAGIWGGAELAALARACAALPFAVG